MFSVHCLVDNLFPTSRQIYEYLYNLILHEPIISQFTHHPYLTYPIFYLVLVFNSLNPSIPSHHLIFQPIIPYLHRKQFLISLTWSHRYLTILTLLHGRKLRLLKKHQAPENYVSCCLLQWRLMGLYSWRPGTSSTPLRMTFHEVSEIL